MKKLFFVVFCLLASSLHAQTLEQAKKMLQDGDIAKAEKALKTLASRKNTEATLLLAQLYLKEYRFEDANEQFSAFKALSLKAKKDISAYEKDIQQASTGTQMMLGVEDVVIIDSLVTDKRSFLSAYKLGTDAGRLFWYKDFFNTQDENWGTVYQTELENHILFSNNGKISVSTHQLNEWSTPTLLSDHVNSPLNNNYPFLCSDGVTLYFASMGHGALGGYDIFVTRYDADNNNYLQAENVGMPFNSPFNDYMMAIDENYQLGWFASDRYQPDGKVCVYIFIPNESKKTYDIDAYSEKQLIRFARITALKESWKGREKEVKEALSRLARARTDSGREVVIKKQIDFELVINDEHTYTTLNDFKSSEARKQASTWLEQQKTLSGMEQALDNAREQYAKAAVSQKKNMSLSLLNQEKRVEELQTKIAQMELSIRNTEIKKLTK